MVLFTFLLFFAGVCALLNAECEQCLGSGTLLRAAECKELPMPVLVLNWEGADSLMLELDSVQPHPPLTPGHFYEVWRAPDGAVSIR